MIGSRAWVDFILMTANSALIFKPIESWALEVFELKQAPFPKCIWRNYTTLNPVIFPDESGKVMLFIPVVCEASKNACTPG